jgi:GMP synthase (glutamine-hydrolysing)
VLGLQFHAEVDAADIERWLIGHASEIASAGLDVPSLRAASGQHGARLAAAGGNLLTQWLAGLNGQR